MNCQCVNEQIAWSFGSTHLRTKVENEDRVVQVVNLLSVSHGGRYDFVGKRRAIRRPG